MSSCRSCGAPVRWVETTSGRRMPLDPTPNAKGNVYLEPGVPTATVFGNLQADARKALAGRLYLSHFATCPDADDHRRSPRRSRR